MTSYNTQVEYIFVYGSLMAGVHSLVAQTFHAQSELVGPGQVQGALYDLGEYPGLVLQPNGAYVKGHVFRILEGEILLPFLDDYEGLMPEAPGQSEYRRESVHVDVSGQIYLCWVYLYNQPTEGLSLIESGNYLQYLETNPAHLAFLRSLRANSEKEGGRA